MFEKNHMRDDNACLCYDGIMLEKELYNIDILTESNRITFDKFGMNLTFEQKEMEHYLDILDGHIQVYTYSRNTGPADLKTLEYKLLTLINTSHFRNDIFCELLEYLYNIQPASNKRIWSG